MVYKIGIVDDEPDVVQALSDMLTRYKDDKNRGGGYTFEFNICTYGSGDEFLNDSPDHFDIIFLDINMPGANGLQTAKRVRDAGSAAAIIFVTHYAQYAVKGYEVNAVGYLVKPIDERVFRRNLDRTFESLKSRQAQKLRIKTEHGIEVVLVSDIVYIEVQIHNIIFHTLVNGEHVEHRVRGTMRGVCADLAPFDFSQCSAAYLVNLRHITALKNKEVYLHGNKVLPVSRKFYKQFSDSFVRYMGSAGGIV
ncbi:MAG: LytTR family DNA-binding domain-containing protein [Clostridia bacterium]|nr:LytTR family DNA-binding domain-containing protein [Clostridia bacterium]